MIRLIIILCLGLAPSVLAQESNSPKSDSANSRSNSEAQNQEGNAPPISLGAIEQQLRAIADNTAPDQKAEARQEDREIETLDVAQRDVIQQETMAKFTRLLYLVTAFSALVGIGGLVALVLTLRATIKTAESNRAWITPKGDPTIHIAAQRCEVTVGLSNDGDSPAIDVIIKAHVTCDGVSPTVSLKKDAAWGYLGRSESRDVELGWKDRTVPVHENLPVYCQIDVTYKTIHGTSGGVKTIWKLVSKKTISDAELSGSGPVAPFKIHIVESGIF